MLADYVGFFTRNNIGNFGFRWLHILMGITWIGLLYYFNFVQVPAFAAYGDEGKARNIALDKVARRALWYFRWSAASTAVTGILISIITEDYYSDGFGSSGKGLAISLGMLLGIIMLVNVWAIIWRNQKIVLANAVNVLNGGEADPNAAVAARKSGMASRQNVVFSVAMLFFMVYAAHGPYSFATDLSGGKVAGFWIISLIIVAVLELNALQLMPWKGQANKGLNVLYDGPGVRNPIIASFALWAVFLILTEIFLKP